MIYWVEYDIVWEGDIQDHHSLRINVASPEEAAETLAAIKSTGEVNGNTVEFTLIAKL